MELFLVVDQLNNAGVMRLRSRWGEGDRCISEANSIITLILLFHCGEASYKDSVSSQEGIQNGCLFLAQ